MRLATRYRSRFNAGTWIFALALLLLPAFCVALDVPPHDAQHEEVTDLAGVLSNTEVDALVSKIRSLRSTDGTAVVVLTIPTLDGDDLFDFAHRVATTWKIGQSKTDNGVLLLIVKNDRKVRIHVGYGLEGRLTDALSKRIISNEIQPEFRSGRYYQGIDRAVSAIIKAVKGEYTAPPIKPQNRGSEGSFWFIIIIMVVFWIFSIRAARRGRRSGGVVFFPGFGGGWSSGGDGGWSSGGGSSSGGGWSSGDSGGSFGGGDFGGGGASGDW